MRAWMPNTSRIIRHLGGLWRAVRQSPIALSPLAAIALLTTVLSVSAFAAETSGYEQVPPSWDGIGKQYMGREIAQVMGYQGAAWLERNSRSQEEAPDKLVSLLPLQSTDIVADIGAGTGYMSVRMAERVPDGQVLAVDLQPEMVDLLTYRLQAEQIEQVRPILGSERSPNLAEQSIDLAIMVDVYHELEYPKEMLEAIFQALKPDGKLVLAEYKAESPWVRIKPHHKMTQSQAKAEVTAAGFHWKTALRGLPQQHLLIFEKN